MSPTSTLPPELLCHIFLFALEEENWSTWTPTRSPYAFSQVCRFWRAVALGEPKLWRDLTLAPTKRWTEELIRRSEGANMVVCVSSSRWVRTIVARYLHRIEDLKLLGVDTDCVLVPHHDGGGSSDEELPLRSLRVSSTFGWLSRQVRTHSYPTPLDLDVAAIVNRSPKLNELSFADGANLVWGTCLPPNLTRLNISDAERPTLTQFLAALRQTPRLEYLILSGCCPDDEAGGFPPLPTNKIDLPYLRNLDVDIIHLETQSFFRYLNVPSNRVALTCRNGPNQPTPLPVIQYLSDHFCHQDVRFRWPTLRHLALAVLPSQFTLNMWLLPEPIQSDSFYEWKEETQEQSLPLQIYIHFGWGTGISTNFPGRHFLPFFTQLCQGLPLHNLQVLSLSDQGLDFMLPENFDYLLKNLPELIFLKSSVSRYLLWHNLWLGHKHTKKRKNCTSPTLSIGIPLPKLRYVTVTMEPTWAETEGDKQRADGLYWMRKWLRARLASGGSRIRRLEFTSRLPLEKTNPGFAELVDTITYTRNE